MDKNISTVHDMIKEMKVDMDMGLLTEIAPTPRNELAYSVNNLPTHKVSSVVIKEEE